MAGTPGRRRLSLSPTNTGGGVLDDAPGGIDVEATTLRDLLGTAPGPVDLVKLDCEGAEYEILAALDADGFARVRRFALEYHAAAGRSAAQGALALTALLEGHGYRVAVNPDPANPVLFAARPPSPGTR
jgi:hypothetical protein